MSQPDGRTPALRASDLETDNLRSCVNDLVGVLSLRSLWSGGTPLRIAEVLADALAAVLEPDFIYIRLVSNSRSPEHEVFRTGETLAGHLTALEVSTLLDSWSGGSLNLGVGISQRLLGGMTMTLVAHHLGVRGDFGVVMMGARREGFPSATERLLVNVAASQALIGFQENARLSEQQMRAAELDHQVAQRTVELAITNKMLRRSEALLNEGQRLSLTGSVAWNPAKNEIAWSEQIGRLFDIQPGGSFDPASFYARVHPDDRSACEALVSQAKIEVLEDRAYEFRLVTQTGDVKHMHLVWRSIQEDSGDIEYLGAIQDVTERREAEASARAAHMRMSEMRDQLAHANRLATVGQLSAAISHDVRQPLTSVMLSAQSGSNWLSATPPNVPAAQRALERVINGAQRATDILDRTKAFAKKSSANRECMILDDVVTDTVALIDPDARHRGIIIATRLHGTFATMADRVQIQQVVMNLLVNAVDAIGSADLGAKEIEIRTFDEGETAVILEVEDTGPGIPDAQLAQLFDAFFTTKPDGMGMGLAICRDIVEAHGGSLNASSSLSVGTTFRVTLPRASDPEGSGSLQLSG